MGVRRTIDGERTDYSTVVVEAVAEQVGVDPVDLDPRLSDVVDADALETLLASVGNGSPNPLVVEFVYAGCRVVVDSDGEVIVEGDPGDVAIESSSPEGNRS